MGQLLSVHEDVSGDGGGSEFCPSYMVRFSNNLTTRWRELRHLFQTEGKEPLEMKTKDTGTKRKFLEPFFDVMTDYVNRNTHLQAMLEALDQAAIETNAMLHRRKLKLRAKLADGTFGARKSYSVEMRIVLKGGNLLRLYQLLYQHVMPLYFFEEIEQNYKQYFKKGDLDLEFILVDRDHPSQFLYADSDDKYGREALQIISYNMLNTYRNLLFEGGKPFRHLTFCGQGSTSLYAQHRLDVLFEELKSAQKDLLDDEDEQVYKKAKLVGVVIGQVVHGIKRNVLESELKKSVASGKLAEREQRSADRLLREGGSFRLDAYTEMDEADPLTRRFFRLSAAPGSNIFITIHRQIRIAETAPDGSDALKNFMLGRVMLNSVLLFRHEGIIVPLNMRGEIIDFATSYTDDFKLKIKKKIFDLKTLGMKYTYIFGVHTLSEDLYFMLFRENEFPWEDKKYEKRLVRMLFFKWLEVADNAYMNRLGETLHLATPITTKNHTTHAYMRRMDLVLPEKATHETKDFNDYLKVIDAFRTKLATMLAKHKKRHNTPLSRVDMFDALALKNEIKM